MNTNDKSITCGAVKSQITNWLANELSATERTALDAHVADCADCQQEVAAMQQVWQQIGNVPTPKPSPELNRQFYAMLNSFEATEKAAKQTPWANLQTWLQQQNWVSLAPRLAYSLLLLGVGVAIGYGVHRAQAPTVAYRQRIDTLSVQVEEMREMMMLSMLENPSATERLRAVGYTKDIDKVDSHVIEALLTTLNNDPNVNVRLVTLEALAELARDARVREGLVQSLTKQESPLVQVALADVMVKLQEKRSLKPLRQLLRQPGTNDLVKTKLEQTIRELS